MNEITTNHIANLINNPNPDAALYARLTSTIGDWEAGTLTPDQVTDEWVPIYLTHLGPEDGRGLCVKEREPVTTAMAASGDWWAFAQEDLARELTSRVEGIMRQARLGHWAV